MDLLDAGSLLEQAHHLARRLERLSADSTLARRASGYRASLLKAIDEIEKANREGKSISEGQMHHLRSLLRGGYNILERAFKEYYRTYRGARPSKRNIR